MTTKLLTKEERYFPDFREMISYVHQIGDITCELFSAEVPDKTLLLKLKPLQIGCDDVLSKIVTRLNETYVTPIYREDIYALAEKINNISYKLVNACLRVEAFNIIKKIKYTDQFANNILRQLVELELAIDDLKIQRINKFKEIKNLRIQSENVYQTALHELFASKLTALEIIKEKEIIELLENASVECQSAADVILAIFINNVS